MRPVKAKKSLQKAIEQAIQMSVEHPNMKYWVMDKPKQQSFITASEWVYNEHILHGWHTHSIYKAGKRVE